MSRSCNGVLKSNSNPPLRRSSESVRVASTVSHTFNISPADANSSKSAPGSKRSREKWPHQKNISVTTARAAHTIVRLWPERATRQV
jgi:hypothetical protein